MVGQVWGIAGGKARDVDLLELSVSLVNTAIAQCQPEAYRLIGYVFHLFLKLSSSYVSQKKFQPCSSPHHGSHWPVAAV
jgi:hypothetical protein